MEGGKGWLCLQLRAGEECAPEALNASDSWDAREVVCVPSLYLHGSGAPWLLSRSWWESRQHSQDTCGGGDGDGDTAVVPTAHSSAPCGLSCRTAPEFTAPHSLVSP